MGRPRKAVAEKVERTPSGEHALGVFDGNKPEPTNRLEEIRREKLVESRKPFIGVKPKKRIPFDVQVVVGDEQNSWISTTMANYFGFKTCGYRGPVKRWDFPLSIKDKFKRHEVYREYFFRVNGKMLMVDLFDKGTPKSEINRIKAHLEALGFQYTYWIGGEDYGNEKQIETVYKDRVAPLDKKSKDYPVIKVPRTLQEANFGGHVNPAKFEK